MATDNPFSPRFGAVPPVLAGRREIQRDLRLVADGDLNSPSCASLLLGTRGMGKTTLLQVLEESFESRGWFTLSVTAQPAGDLLEDLSDRAVDLHHRVTHGLNPQPRRRLTGAGAFGVNVTTELVEPPDRRLDLRQTLARLGEAAQQQGSGLFVSVDELQDADVDEVRRFGAVFQHESSRNRLPIVFVGAGMLEMQSTLLAGRRSTFLHRCEQYEIGLLPAAEARRALSEPLAAASATIAPEALTAMLDAAAGHPYMLQLVGYEVWQAAADPPAGISLAEACAGITEARHDMGPRIYGPIWRGLSDTDKRLLVAMLLDPHRSHLSDLARRWGGEPKQIGTYRHRLILRGVIRSAGRGVLMFSHPEARRYTAAAATEEGWGTSPDGVVRQPTDPDIANLPEEFMRMFSPDRPAPDPPVGPDIQEAAE